MLFWACFPGLTFSRSVPGLGSLTFRQWVPVMPHSAFGAWSWGVSCDIKLPGNPTYSIQKSGVGIFLSYSLTNHLKILWLASPRWSWGSVRREFLSPLSWVRNGYRPCRRTSLGGGDDFWIYSEHIYLQTAPSDSVAFTSKQVFTGFQSLSGPLKVHISVVLVLGVEAHLCIWQGF